MSILVLLSVILSLVDYVSTAVVTVPPVDGKTQSEAVNFMMQFGYLRQKDARLGQLRTKADMDRAIKEVQRFAGIKVTGKIDQATVKLMKTPRCGRPDFGPTDNMRRRKRYALHGTKWLKHKLTYRILNKPEQTISKKQVSDTIRKAFDMWTRVSPLTFREIHQGIADIMISFKAGLHNDGFPFDGVGGTIAHAFYPHQNKGEDGDVHFDDDERWVLDTPEGGTDFLWTAVHEIGHAIGLDHSYYRQAIMYPYYRGYKENVQLNEDDIVGIQNIYGKPKARPAIPPHTKVTARGNGPSPCRSTVDAVFHSKDGNTYFFKDTYFWKLDKYNRISTALKVKDHWPELRRRVQAAYTRRDGKTVFFKGRRYWVYEGTKYIEGPRHIKDYGLPLKLKRLDAVFVWAGNGKTYFFKGRQYWRYNEKTRSVDPGYPKNITEGWGVVPQPVDSVMTWKDGHSYFFSGLDFQRYDFHKRHHYMPEKIGKFFMKCSDIEMLGYNKVGSTTVFTPLLALLTMAVSLASM